MSEVNHPKHYQECSIECIDAMIVAYGIPTVYEFCKCNAFKYLWRFRSKGGLIDLDKALWYVNKARLLIDENSIPEEICRLHNVISTHRASYIEEMAFKEKK